MSFDHALRVRYSEVDKQGVLYNAHYMAYCDDATDTWFRAALDGLFEIDVDVMLKAFSIEWQRPAHLGDMVAMTAAVSRYGRTSFDVEVAGCVAGEAAFMARLVYVCVRPNTTETIPIPQSMRAALA
ncbi:MAG: acyl-CoA thioesterase [Acidimicrobiia bacterium]